ncbi:MAG: SDR family oxidoreductase [Rhizobiaceae bacterium]|nr:SDR family oxidoreductase [Rhizobiaceae bacterium]
MTKPLEGKIAVVTGAGNGIGRASALRFSADGATLALLDLDKSAVEGVAAEVKAAGGKALPLALDCSNADQIVAAFAAIRKELGKPDILLNNVGQSARERMSDFVNSDMAVLDFILDVNLKSCILCSRQVVNDMKERGSGKIINLTSESAVNGSLKTWDYSAAKAGVIGFTRAVARELAPYGINVNAVGPGMTRTRAMDQLPQDLVQKIADAIPARRAGKPEDIANAIAFFASDQSDYVTGQTLLVNGGNWML